MQKSGSTFIAHYVADYAADYGFTLVEISIVLVIIGLVIGGVLAGRDLVTAAELRKVVTDMEKIDAAVNAFRSKYNGLPGDLTTATDIWGTDPEGGCPVIVNGIVQVYPVANLHPKKETCNGDGDGIISTLESWRFWQQLADAGFIPGQYSGTYADAAITLTTKPGINSPPSIRANTVYWTSNMGTFGGANRLASWLIDRPFIVFLVQTIFRVSDS